MGPPREIGIFLVFFYCFLSVENWPQMAPNRARRIFVPTNPDLADFFWQNGFAFKTFYFCDFLDTTFLDVQVPRSPNFQISRFPDFQTAPVPAPQGSQRTHDESSDANLTTHSGIKYIERSPRCDIVPAVFHRFAITIPIDYELGCFTFFHV